ncbi:MAG: hypothetical protein NTY35_13705 [Planctomycetota bacterium]|nr:hypothetical protein [Planctomycetota bacterium]
MKRILVTTALVVALAAMAFTFHGCASTVKNVDPTGKSFPTTQGKALDGKEHALPADFAGSPIVFLVGYVQDAQFDLDRWILGLLQAKTPVRIAELPTIDSLIATAFSSQIDQGMQSGIPSEDWASVITVYGGEGSKIVAFTGNEKPRNARVLLLDAGGKVVWFHDRGYSGGKVLELDARVRELSAR